MSSQPESDSAKGITGIDTFGLWLVGYRAGLLATLPRKHVYVPDIPKNDELVGSMLEHFPEAFDPHAGLYLRKCPWIEIPLSIQALLKKQYPSAEADVEKYVNIGVQNDDIRFTLRSPLVVNGVETYGEYRVYGLRLQIETDESLTGSKEKKGVWCIRKYPVGAHIEVTVENVADVLRRNTPRHEIFPTTVNELQDLVRFLEKSKHRAEARELQIKLTE